MLWCYVSHRTRLLTVTTCQVARVRSGTRKEDPGEVMSKWLGFCLCNMPWCQSYDFTISLWHFPPPLSMLVTIDTPNNHVLLSQKELNPSVKSSSSVELGSLYRQIEVSAGMTERLEKHNVLPLEELMNDKYSLRCKKSWVVLSFHL